ncbi:MAG: hypothetical protein P8R42_12890 [Candidatus Binatia bacterium]|nr:hypothetical protein [Candidatus Binatia bacterium]
MPGTVYTVPPIPPDPANTTYVAGGGLRIGVEHRLLDAGELAANYEGAAMEEVQANITGDIEDNGLSLHVEGADGHEYLRFDCFTSGPHYHYIEPSGEQQTIVDFDRVALGEMLPWVLHQLRTRLDAMLEYAGGGALLSTINRAEVDRLLPEVEHLARRAESELASQKKQRR